VDFQAQRIRSMTEELLALKAASREGGHESTSHEVRIARLESEVAALRAARG